jgi:hypothetical protein
LQGIRALLWQHLWMLLITVPGLASVLYWILTKVRVKPDNKSEEDFWSRRGMQ